MSETTPDPRRDRLKASLRDNLKRRKAQARSRAAATTAEENAEPDGGRETGPATATRDRQGPRGD